MNLIHIIFYNSEPITRMNFFVVTGSPMFDCCSVIANPIMRRYSRYKQDIFSLKLQGENNATYKMIINRINREISLVIDSVDDLGKQYLQYLFEEKSKYEELIVTRSSNYLIFI